MPPATVDDFVAAAREYVRRAVGLELDLSVESLAYVDHYLSQVGAVSDELLALIAPAVGAYLGEVAIAHLGGAWRTAGPATDWSVTLEAAPIAFTPAGLVAEAIRHEPVEGFDGAVVVPPEHESLLADALAASGPVAESYYYSVTGRLETIEHMLEILVELRRRALDRTEPT